VRRTVGVQALERRTPLAQAGENSSQASENSAFRVIAFTLPPHPGC
jgi:hypothetical protein